MNVRELLNKAKDYSVKLKYDKARDLLSKVIEQNPLNYQALTTIRKNFVRSERFIE